jgi:hypothetical protein
MSWSYSVNELSAPLNFIRFKIGDTNSQEPFLQDEEINCIIAIIPNLNMACSKCALAIAAKVASRHDIKKLGPQLINDTGLYNRFIDLSKQLLLEAKHSSAFAGCIKTPHVSAFDIGMQDDKTAAYTGRTLNSLDGSLADASNK